MSRISEILAAMGDEKRLKIILELAKKEMTVNEIAEKIKASQPNTSQHLQKLFHVKQLKKKKKGQKVVYSLEKRKMIKELEKLIKKIDGEKNDGK